MQEFANLCGITRMSIIKWAKEYGFHLEEIKAQGGKCFLIDINLATIFKEIKVIRKEIKYCKIAAHKRNIDYDKCFKTNKDKYKKYSAFKVGDLYEVFLNDAKSPKNLGWYNMEKLHKIKDNIAFF